MHFNTKLIPLENPYKPIIKKDLHVSFTKTSRSRYIILTVLGEKREKAALNVRAKGVSGKAEKEIIKPVSNEEKKVVTPSLQPKEAVKPATPVHERKISKKELAENITNKINAKSENKEYISDDQFFDDFFADDE